MNDDSRFPLAVFSSIIGGNDYPGDFLEDADDNRDDGRMYNQFRISSEEFEKDQWDLIKRFPLKKLALGLDEITALVQV